MRKLTTIVTLVALLVMASVCWAQRNPQGPGSFDFQRCHHKDKPGPGIGMGVHTDRPGMQMILAVADEIKLTDDQKAKMEKMLVDFQLAKVDQRAKVKKAGIRLKALMHDESADENEIMATIDEVTRLKADLQKMRYRHQREIHKLLTDEQIDKLKELRKEKMKKFKGLHGGRGPGEPGMGFGSGSGD
jgi:Spy/CpxP family protein refolding chaperone